MSIVVIVTDFFSPDFMIEPDVVEWVQEYEDDKDFENRHNAVMFSTSGDVRALFPHICSQPPEFLKGLLEALIDTRLRMYCLSNPSVNMGSKDWFVNNYNDMVGLKGGKRFPTKTSILHSYYGGSLTDGGQEILSTLAGTEKDFNKEIAKMHTEFALFISTTERARVGMVDFVPEKDNPFEGGFQVKVDLIVPGVDDPQLCTLHWAPWPTAKTKSANTEVRALCHSFTEMNRSLWLSSMEN